MGKEYGFQAKWVGKGKGMDPIGQPYSQRAEIMVKLAKVSSKGYLKGPRIQRQEQILIFVATHVHDYWLS